MKKQLSVGVLARVWVPIILKSQRSDPDRRIAKADLRDLFRFTKQQMEELGIKEAQGGLEFPLELTETKWTIEVNRQETDLLKETLKTFQGYDLDDVWQDDLLEQLNSKVVNIDEAT